MNSSDLRWMSGRYRPARTAAVVALACSVGACGSAMNMLPDPGNFRLPDRSTFLPTSNSFTYQISPNRPVGPEDLVNGQGQCAASAAPADGTPRGVRLDMTECQVVSALGQPQAVDFTTQSGGEGRHVTMTYKTGERPGIYEFRDGRLSAIDRGEEEPVEAKKPAAKRSRSKPSA